jgi:hypothetical protein
MASGLFKNFLRHSNAFNPNCLAPIKGEVPVETDGISISSILQKILTPPLNIISNLFKFNK